MPLSRRLLALALIISSFLPVVAQARAGLCSGLFSESRTIFPVFDIAGAQRIQTSNVQIKGAVTYNTNSIVNHISEIKFSLLSTQFQLQMALLPQGAMGFAGPLGPLGPLSQWGPVGSKLVNQSQLVSSIDWNKHAKYLNSNGGPLDKNGVFGQYSALSKNGDFLNSLLPDTKAVDEGSPLMVLGTKGLLGPYGLLGALGPNGAHGYKRDHAGNYLNEKGQVVTETSVQTENGKTTEKLVELYTDAQAILLSEKNMLQDRFAIDLGLPHGQIKNYKYTAKAGEWIMFGVTPSGFGDYFSIEVIDLRGNTLSKANSNQHINMSVFKFAHDAEVIIRIKNEGRSPYYNAFVESMNNYYSALASMNPFLNVKDLMPPNVLTQTSKCRVIVGTSPAKDNADVVPGPHWSQFE